MSENVPAPIFGLEAQLVFQSFLEEFERGQIARAQAQAFQVEKLDERDQPQQGDERRGWQA